MATYYWCHPGWAIYCTVFCVKFSILLAYFVGCLSIVRLEVAMKLMFCLFHEILVNAWCRTTVGHTETDTDLFRLREMGGSSPFICELCIYESGTRTLLLVTIGALPCSYTKDLAWILNLPFLILVTHSSFETAWVVQNSQADYSC